MVGDKPGVRKEEELLEDVNFLRKTPGIHLMEKLNKFRTSMTSGEQCPDGMGNVIILWQMQQSQNDDTKIN